VTTPLHAPKVSLTAVGSRRTVRLDSPGLPLLLICFAQETQAGIEAIEDVVRERWPLASDLLVAHVVDLHKVPSLFRSVAERMLAAEHSKASDALQPGLLAYDYVVILPDWQGAVAPALGHDDPAARHGWAVLSAVGEVIDSSTDPLQPERLLNAVARAIHGAS
jgi:hypothetical protein